MEAREALARIVDCAAYGIIGRDIEGKITSWNHAAELIYGWPAEEIIGQPVSALAPPDRMHELEELSESIQKGVAIDGFETERIRKDGSRIHIALSLSPVRDATNRIVGAAAIVRDVTKQKQAERALAESAEKYRSLFSAMAEGAVFLDENGVARAVNPALERILGRAAGELIGRAPFDWGLDAISEEGTPFAAGMLPAEVTLRTGEPQFDVVMGLRRPDGALVWVSMNAQPLKSPKEDRPRAVVATFHDISRHKAAGDLRASELKYQDIFNNVSDALFLMDVTEDGHFRFADLNPAAEKLCGKSRDELVGRHLDAIPQQAIRDRIAPRFHHCLETGETICREELLPFPTGPRYLRSVQVPLRNDRGAIYRILSVDTDITDLKATEAELRLREERCQSLVFATSQLIWVADKQGNAVEDSASWLAFTGQTPEDARGRGWLAAVHPDDRERVAAQWSHAVETGELFQTEYRVRRFDGKYRTFANRGVAVLDPNGAIREWVGACIDITERKLAEQMLLESEEHFRALSTAAQDAILSIDDTGAITFWNEAASRTFGYAASEALGQNVHTLLAPPRYHDAINSAWRRFAEEGQGRYMSRLIELDALRKGGAEFPVELTISPVRLGGRWNAVGIVRDITQRRQAEEATRLQADQYTTMLTASADGFWLVDRDGRFRDVNDAACRMSGYSREELLKLSVSDLEANETPEETSRRFRRVEECGYDHFESRHRRKDGSIIDVEISSAFWKTTRRQIVFIRDITERKRAEEALRLSEAKLHEAQEMAEVASWDWDLGANTLHWSAGECSLLGCNGAGPPSTFSEFLSWVHPDDRKKLKEGVEEVRRTGAPFQLEYRIIQPSGEIRTVDARMKGYADRKGQPIRIGGTVRDITAAKLSEERLKTASHYARNLIEASLDPIMTVSPEGRITDINEAGVRALGRPRELIIGSVFADFFTEPARAAVVLRAALSTGYVTNYPLAINHSAEQIHLLLNVSIYRNARNEPEGVLVAARDVTEQNRRSKELLKLHEQMTTTVAELRQRERDTTIIDELSETLQTCKTRDEAYPLIGVAGKQLFPWSNGGLAVFVSDQDLNTVVRWGEKPQLLSDFTLEDCWALRRGQLHRLSEPSAGAACHHFEEPPAGPSLCLPLAIPGEALGMLHLNSSSPRALDERVSRLLVTLGDVVKLSLSNLKLRETLRLQAIRDPLTNLFNRHYLNETLPREIQRAQRLDLPLCLAMLDVDHFKDFNDRHGHDAGDLVLKEVGVLLRKAVRESDMACRYGGEEFLFVLSECDLPAARERLQQICEDIRTKVCMLHGHALPAISMSVGLAQLGDGCASDADLIAAADAALYAAKHGGRNRICTYSEDMTLPAQSLAGSS